MRWEKNWTREEMWDDRDIDENAPGPFRVAFPCGDKGRGLVATRTIRRGERILDARADTIFVLSSKEVGFFS